MKLVFLIASVISSTALAGWAPLENGCIGNVGSKDSLLLACPMKDGGMVLLFAEQDGCVPDRLVLTKKSVPIQCEKVKKESRACVVDDKTVGLIAEDPKQPLQFFCGKKEIDFNLTSI